MSESSLNLEFVKGLPLQKVYMYALKHLQNLERKKLWNRKYNSMPKIKAKQRTYYYKKYDIFHPEFHPQGTVEKRWKRQHADLGERDRTQPVLSKADKTKEDSAEEER